MAEKASGPAYWVTTTRLLIRCWDPKDAALLKAAIDESLDHLRPWMAWTEDEPEELQKKIDRLRRYRGLFDLGSEFHYGIFDHEEKGVLGAIGLHTRVGPDAREIGYWIHQGHIHQGLATEATAAMVKVAFEINGAERVEVHCDPANACNAAIPRKLGFTQEAILRRRQSFGNLGKQDQMIWTLFDDQYPSSPSAESSIQAFDAIGRRIL
jgi:RimJ/RimL family protein N-acetyltransferase